MTWIYFPNLFPVSGYGLFYATDGGRDVDFPIGHPKYLPPEVVVGGPKGTFSTTSTSAATTANDVDLGGSFDDRPSVEGSSTN